MGEAATAGPYMADWMSSMISDWGELKLSVWLELEGWLHLGTKLQHERSMRIMNLGLKQLGGQGPGPAVRGSRGIFSIVVVQRGQGGQGVVACFVRNFYTMALDIRIAEAPWGDQGPGPDEKYETFISWGRRPI